VTNPIIRTRTRYFRHAYHPIRDNIKRVIVWCLRIALSNGLGRVGVSQPSPEDGKRSSFRNVVFFCVFRIADDGKIPKTQQS
jgi:hypothetical protein